MPLPWGGEQAKDTMLFFGFIVCDQCFVIKEKSSSAHCHLGWGQCQVFPSVIIFDHGCCYQKAEKEIKRKIIFEYRLCMKVCVAQSGLAVLRRTCISIKCLSSLNRKRHLRHTCSSCFPKMWFQYVYSYTQVAAFPFGLRGKMITFHLAWENRWRLQSCKQARSAGRGHSEGLRQYHTWLWDTHSRHFHLLASWEGEGARGGVLLSSG